MANSFRCKIVTPTASLLDDNVSSATVPLWDGSAGFLPGRAPLLAKLGVGELHVEIADSKSGKGGSRSFAVGGGFAKMSDGQLTILAERAMEAQEVILADAEAQLKKAESDTTGKSAADRSWAQARIRVAKGGKGI